MGHLNEVFWETELYEAPPELADRLCGCARSATRVAAPPPATSTTSRSTRRSSRTRSPGIARRSATATPARSHPEPGVPMFSTLTCNAIRSTHDLALVPDASAATRARRTTSRSAWTRSSTSSAPPTSSWPTTPRSSSARASTGWTRSCTCTCASRAASDRGQLGRVDQLDARLGAAGAPAARRAARPYFRNVQMPDSMMESLPGRWKWRGPRALHRDRAVRRRDDARLDRRRRHRRPLARPSPCAARASTSTSSRSTRTGTSTASASSSPATRCARSAPSASPSACLAAGLRLHPVTPSTTATATPLGPPTDFPLPPGAPGRPMNGITRPTAAQDPPGRGAGLGRRRSAARPDRRAPRPSTRRESTFLTTARAGDYDL